MSSRLVIFKGIARPVYFSTNVARMFHSFDVLSFNGVPYKCHILDYYIYRIFYKAIHQKPSTSYFHWSDQVRQLLYFQGG